MTDSLEPDKRRRSRRSWFARAAFRLQRAIAKIAPASLRYRLDPWADGGRLPELGFPLVPPQPGFYGVPIQYEAQRETLVCGFAALSMIAGGRGVFLDQLKLANAIPWWGGDLGFVIPDLAPLARRLGLSTAYSYVWEPAHLAGLPAHGWTAIVGVLASRLAEVYAKRGIENSFPPFKSEVKDPPHDGHVVLLYGATVSTEGTLAFRIADPANLAASAVDLSPDELVACDDDSFGIGLRIEALAVGPEPIRHDESPFQAPRMQAPSSSGPRPATSLGSPSILLSFAGPERSTSCPSCLWQEAVTQ